MAEKKNQHFVPKLYLKLFSVNKNSTQIGLFNLSKQLYIDKVAIKNQAKENYFYGEDGLIEEQLSIIESQAAPCLKEILLLNRLPKKLTPEWIKLLTFTIFLANRTKDTAQHINELTEKLAKTILSYDERFSDFVDKYTIQPTNPAALALAVTAKRLSIAFDLRIKLLINRTSTKFITSDDPVVRYNQFLERRKHPGGNVGLATKGLQLFFPISPTHMLILYDEWVYKIGDKLKDAIHLDNQKDIDELNFLQVLNCLDHLYFNEDISKGYIERLSKIATGKRQNEYTSIQKSYSYFDKKGQEHIGFHSYGNNIEVGLNLSFITQTKKAKHHTLSDYAVQLRNENLRKRN